MGIHGRRHSSALLPYLTRMDKPPAPMLRDYGPSVEDGTTWVTGSPARAEDGYRRIYLERSLPG